MRAPGVTVDVRTWRQSGIGTYVRQLVPRLVALRPDLRWTLLGRSVELAGEPVLREEQVAFQHCDVPIYSVREQISLPFCAPPGQRVFWSPHYNIPLLGTGKLLVTVHDLAHLALQQYRGAPHRRLYAEMMFRAAARKAEAILCDSLFTADELVRRADADPRRISVVSLGVDRAWFHVQPDTMPHARPYLLFVGNVKPHKNLAGLIRAFALLLNRVPHDLVIVGQQNGLLTGDASAPELAAALGGRVCFTGYVGDALLRQYYAHAAALVLPSFYEGFGLPALEAMACGTPVAVSRVASLPEVCGTAALYFDPYDSREMAAVILSLLTDSGLSTEMRERGRERAREFTWKRCAQQTAAVLDELIG